MATYNGDAHNNSVSSGAADEPVTVGPATPLISTNAQPTTGAVGSQVADQATVSGGESPSGTVTFKLYDNPSGTGTPLYTDANEPLSNGTAQSGSYTVTSTGTDYWVATYNGDADNNSVSSGAADEPVTIGPATPSISTSAQPSSTTVGGAVADQATVSGGDSPSGTVTFTLYDNSAGTGPALFTSTKSLVGGTATSASYTTTSDRHGLLGGDLQRRRQQQLGQQCTGGEPVSITTASKLADLSITMSGPTSAADGSSFTEKVTVKNAGPANAGNVLTTVIVPTGLTVTNTGGGQLVAGTTYWTANQIAAGGQASYTVTFKVGAHAGGTALIPAGTASLANPDPNYANNVTATTVRLGAAGPQAQVARLRNPLPRNQRLAAYLRALTRPHHASRRQHHGGRSGRMRASNGHRAQSKHQECRRVRACDRAAPVPPSSRPDTSQATRAANDPGSVKPADPLEISDPCSAIASPTDVDETFEDDVRHSGPPADEEREPRREQRQRSRNVTNEQQSRGKRKTYREAEAPAEPIDSEITTA